MQKIDFDGLHGVSAGKHLYQFYKNTEDYLRILTAYFAAGLEKGDACLWLASEKTGLEKVREAAEQMIPNAARHLAAGRLEIRSAESWYLTKGRFDEARAADNARVYIAEKREAGFKTFRGAGDMAAIPHQDWNSVWPYEKKIDAFVKGNLITGLCAYPILECAISDTRKVLELHDGVLVGKL
ncbi:MAG TPA: MEDS domain-containing protein [Verrucomicrobiae bacterium]|nr:MEDS domain-containing protein [Verrucomicrobiae bacterium]